MIGQIVTDQCLLTMGIMRSYKETEAKWLYFTAQNQGAAITIQFVRVGEAAKGIICRDF